jgi:hypothetical protein
LRHIRTHCKSNFRGNIRNVLGVLVHGDNHFIVRGPLPDRETALALVRHWSLIRIGQETPAALRSWTISTKEFRENLQWAIVVASESDLSPAVLQLLAELRGRGVKLWEAEKDSW